jgi:hypothetical protein
MLAGCRSLLAIAAAAAAPAAPSAAAAAPLWALTVTREGRVALLFNSSDDAGAPQLELAEGCPALSLTLGEAAITLCDPLYYAGASVQPVTSGVDSRLGPFELHAVTYRPRIIAGTETGGATATAADAARRAPGARLEVMIFPPALRVVHLRLRLDSPLSTNRIEPLSGATFRFRGSGSGSSSQADAHHRILDVPLDNDIQSVYQSVPIGRGALEPGTSCYVTAVYEEASREGFVMGFLENELWKTGVHYR